MQQAKQQSRDGDWSRAQKFLFSPLANCPLTNASIYPDITQYLPYEPYVQDFCLRHCRGTVSHAQNLNGYTQAACKPCLAERHKDLLQGTLHTRSLYCFRPAASLAICLGDQLCGLE